MPATTVTVNPSTAKRLRTLKYRIALVNDQKMQTSDELINQLIDLYEETNGKFDEDAADE